MKSVSKKIILWALIGSVAFSTTGSVYSVEADAAIPALPEKKLDELVEQNKEAKKLPLSKIMRIKGFVRDLFSIIKKRFQIKREKAKKGRKLDSVTTLDELKELYDLDLRQLKLYAAITAAGIVIASVVAIVVTILAQMGKIGKDEKQRENISDIMGGLFFTTVNVSFPLGVGAILIDERLKHNYAKRVDNELWKPRVKEDIALYLEIRKLQNLGDTKNIPALIQQRKHLGDEINAIEKWEDHELIRYVTKHKNELKQEKKKLTINAILEQNNKKIAETSSLYKLLDFAYDKDGKNIILMLERGEIALFDEPWVWPAVAELYYWGDARSSDALVAELQVLVGWQKWYTYWTTIEKKAKQFGLIDRDLESLSVAARKDLVQRVAERVAEKSLGDI